MDFALRYSYRRNVLTLKAAGEDIVFPKCIVQIAAFERTLAVLIEPDPRHGAENVYGIGLDGTILWQIAPRSYPSQAGPYVDLEARGNHLAVWNAYGTTLLMRPVTGRLVDLIEAAEAGCGGSRPDRSPSRPRDGEPQHSGNASRLPS
ncbi:hypothetical protein [Pigmentiphaga sp. NML080357]|uniref:hypothetical protein n=1 Tax=Pigmentiphaga sp. NML080357 TaxID=2008675 RepID=UPI00118646D3|nr:hypothetical protein [Pigmentiphaga sp. NML080357]